MTLAPRASQRPQGHLTIVVKCLQELAAKAGKVLNWGSITDGRCRRWHASLVGLCTPVMLWPCLELPVLLPYWLDTSASNHMSCSLRPPTYCRKGLLVTGENEVCDCNALAVYRCRTCLSAATHTSSFFHSVQSTHRCTGSAACGL